MEIKLARFLPKKQQWIVLLLVGILLVVIALPTESTKTASGTYGTEIERKLEDLLNQMEGVGNTQVMITYRDSDNVQGIVILADGGGNAVIVRNITGVVQALFDVDSHKIKVIEKNQNK